MKALTAGFAVLLLLTACAAEWSEGLKAGNGTTTQPAHEMEDLDVAAIDCSRAQHQADVLFWRPHDGPVACRTFTGAYPPGPSPLAQYTIVGEDMEVHHAIFSGALPAPWSERFDAEPESVEPTDLEHSNSGIEPVRVHGHRGVLKWRNDEYAQRTSLEWVEPLDGTRYLEVRVDPGPLHPADLLRAARRLRRDATD